MQEPRYLKTAEEMTLEEPGVHGDTAWMSREDADYLSQLAKAAKASIEVVDTLGDAQGTYDPKTGRIRIAKDATDPVGFVTQHELTHRIRDNAPQQWGQFLDYVQKHYGEDWNSVLEGYQRRYAEHDIELTAEEAAEEAAADFAGRMNESDIRRLTQENRSLAQKILDAIWDLIRKLKGGENQKLYEMEKLWASALKEGNKNTANEGGVRNSFAGENAKTANLAALERAKKMREQGVAAETVRQETGWFTGADGKWRFEIDDSNARYRKNGDAQLMKEPGYQRLQELTQKWADSYEKGSEALTEAEETEMEALQEEYSDAVWEEKYLLRDFLHHDELFRAYPYLNRVSLDFADLPSGVKGQFNRRTNTITLSNDLIGTTENTLLHEIQHVIQKVEGFSGGSSPEYWARRDAESNEVKNRLAQEREDIFESMSREDRNKYTRYKELERELERLSGAKDGTEDGDRYIRYDRESDKLYLELWGKDWFQKLGTLDRKLESGLGEEYNRLYRNTAGEIEARDTANRRKLTAEERRAKAPDTGNENTVFAEDDAIVGMHEETEEEKRAKPAGREESKKLRMTDPRNMARYKTEVSAAMTGEMRSDEQILIGNPPDILRKYMKSDNLLYMPQRAARKAALTKEEKGGKHGLGPVVLEELPYQLENPMAITGNTSQHKVLNDNSIVVWTDWKTGKGEPVIVPIRIDIEGTTEVYNGANTMFNVFNEEYKNDLLREGNVLYTKNGKSIDDLLLQRRKVPKVQTNNALSDNSVHQAAAKSNPQNAEKTKKSLKSDSRGRALTAAQQEYFTDSQVLDKSGKLLPVYHTTYDEFTTFDRNRLGAVTDGNATDETMAATAHIGFWFNTQDLRKAYGSGSRAEEVYLNITNPLKLNSLDELYNYVSLYGGDGSAAEMGEAVAEALRDYGYDGIALRDEEFGGTSYVALEPEQIKRVTNESPTSDPDMRRSLKGSKEAAEEIERLREQNKRLTQELTALKSAIEMGIGISTDYKSAAKAAEEMRKRFGSKADQTELTEALLDLYDGMAAGTLSNQEMRDLARRAADTVIDGAEGNVNPLYEEYAALHKELRTEKVTLPKENRADIQEGYNALRKRAMGSVKIGNDGIPVDVQYEMLNDHYPELFPDDILNPADQLERMVDVAKSLKKTNKLVVG